MKNILKILSVAFLAILFNSCEPIDDTTYPDIKGIQENLSLIVNQSESFELSGGDNKFEVKDVNTEIAKTTISGKTLTITAKSMGETKLTIISADKVKTITIKVTETPKAGVYMGSTLKVSLKNLVETKNGMWLLEKSGNPYKGARLFVKKLDNNLEKGQSLMLNLKSFNIEGIQSGEVSANIEIITPDVISLKIGELSLIIPKK